MEEQKNNSLSFLASLGLAGAGSVIFVAGYIFVRYYSTLNSQSLLVVWFVMLALILGFLIMPLITYWRTTSVKSTLKVFMLQFFFALILMIISTALIWQAYIG